MKLYIIILFAFFILSSCNSNTVNNQPAANTDTINTSDTSTANSPINSGEETNYDKATYFILIADTGQDYDLLNKKMYSLSNALKIPVDTMGRYYNKTKNRIVLPDNDEDAMYAGKYFPRRFPSVSLSLEYLSSYQKGENEKTIALVSGIYETQNVADSALTILKAKENKSFVIKADIYMGDVH